MGQFKSMCQVPQGRNEDSSSQLQSTELPQLSALHEAPPEVLSHSDSKNS